MKVAAETLAEKTVIKLRKVKRFFLLTERFFSAQKATKARVKKGRVKYILQIDLRWTGFWSPLNSYRQQLCSYATPHGVKNCTERSRPLSHIPTYYCLITKRKEKKSYIDTITKFRWQKWQNSPCVAYPPHNKTRKKWLDINSHSIINLFHESTQGFLTAQCDIVC